MKREVRLFDELDRFAGGGEISHALALSYGYDGDVANERIWTPLIEKYGVRHPLVIAHGPMAEGTALGVHVLRAKRPAGVFHPKLFLAVREDAVFAAIGSANLTRGGLGANLELMTPLVFTKDGERPPPRAVLDGVLGFTERVITDLRIDESSRRKAFEVTQHARLVLVGLPEARRAPDLRFFHSYDEPVWSQLRKMHGDDPVEHLVIVSPFFEVDDPSLDESDSLLRHALSAEGLPWAARAKPPRCTLHVSALGTAMPLPRAALEELGKDVEVRPQALSVEPRRLHGKLVAIFGKKRTTLLWGSPNFTPSALLRTAEKGNLECALALGMDAAAADVKTVLSEFDLGEVFHVHRGPLPEVAFAPPSPPPLVEIGEALYDPATCVLTICGETFSDRVQRLRARLDIKPDAPVLFERELGQAGVFSLEVDAGQIEEEDPDTGKRRLRALTLRIEALDPAGAVLCHFEVRLNVRFEDALEVRQNLLLGPEALTADALLVPSAAPPEQRVAELDRKIELWRAARRGDEGVAVRHQASLDTYFRNVRLGLDARWEGLVRRRSSRFALLRWSHELRRSLAAARADSLEACRRSYLVGRVAEHIQRVLEAIPEWHPDPAPAYAVIEAESLAGSLAAVPLDRGIHEEALAEVRSIRERVVEALLATLSATNKAEKSARRSR